MDIVNDETFSWKFDESKAFQIQISGIQEIPQNYIQPYSPKLKIYLDKHGFKPSYIEMISSNSHNSSHNEERKKEEENKEETHFLHNTKGVQIITYQNDLNYKIVMKRTCFGMKKKLNTEKAQDLLKNEQIVRHIIVLAKEFWFYQITSTHNSGIIAYDFSSTFLNQQNVLVNELITEYGGKELAKLYDFRYHKMDNFKYFQQIVNMMTYFQINKIAHCDMKRENLLLDTETDSIKLIDYDISISQDINAPY